MLQEKGHCKHGEFILTEGCPDCLAESRQAIKDRISGGMEGIEETAASNDATETALSLRPGTDVEVFDYYNEALRLQQYAGKRVIATLEDVKAATDDLSIISKLKRAMEEKRKWYISPLQDQVKGINDTYKILMAPILEADKVTRDKMLAYDAEQKRIRAEQEEINRKRQEAAEQEMRLKGELSESVNLVEVTPEPAKNISTDMGSSGIATIWKFEVVDFALLPDRFKIENAALIGKVVRAGEREIPGVKIWSEDTLRVKAR